MTPFQLIVVLPDSNRAFDSEIDAIEFLLGRMTREERGRVRAMLVTAQGVGPIEPDRRTTDRPAMRKPSPTAGI